jgi:hypothetical protein
MVRDCLYCRHCPEDAGIDERPDIGDTESRIYIRTRKVMDAAGIMRQGIRLPVQPTEPLLEKDCCGHDFSAHCPGPTNTKKERLNPSSYGSCFFYKGGQMKKSRIMFEKLMTPYNFLDQF